MSETTRCCTCGDAIEPGSDVFRGDERGSACSALCRYRIGVEPTQGWYGSADEVRLAGLRRVALAREAVLYDPDVFDQEGVLDVCVKSDGDPAWAATIVLEATVEEVRLEVVAGEWEGSEMNLRWDSILDIVLRDA